MSAIVRNLRTIWDRFESETGKVGSTGGANTRDVFTTDPDPIEATASIGTPIPADLDTMLHQATAADMSDTLVYGWFLTSPPLDSAYSQSSGGNRGPGFGIVLSDDTNIRAYGLGGSNKAGFRHDADRPDWQAIVLDTFVAEGIGCSRPNLGVTEFSFVSLPGAFFADPTERELILLQATASNVTSNQHNASNNADPDFTAITEAGYFVTRLAAAKGGTENTFCDIMRYGTEGIQVIEDTSGAISNFLDIATLDRSGDANAAHAAVRETGQRTYSINSKITIGDSAGGSESVDFVETNAVLGWESYPLKKRFESFFDTNFDVLVDSAGVPRFRIITSSPTTGGTTKFRLGTRTGNGTGGSGCVISVPDLVDCDFKLDDTNVDSVGIYGSIFRNVESIKFRKDRNNTHSAFQNDFIACGPIFANIDYRNNSHFDTGAKLNARGNRFPVKKEDEQLEYIASVGVNREIGHMKALEYYTAALPDSAVIKADQSLRQYFGPIEVLDQNYNVILDSDIIVANGGLDYYVNVGNNHNINPMHIRFRNETLGQTNSGGKQGRLSYRESANTPQVNYYNFYFIGDSGEYASQLTTSQSTLTGLYFEQGNHPSGHAINIDSATPNQEFTLQDCTFLNYASTTGNTGREAIINSSGQPIRVLVSGTTNAPSVDSDGVRGRVTVVNNVTVTISGILGNSEIKVLPTSGSPYSGNTLNDTLSIATETVSADTKVGDLISRYEYDIWNDGGTNRVRLLNVGGSPLSGILTDGDLAATPLAAGDKVRVTVRDDDINPTLQLFDEFTVAEAPTVSEIRFTIANADFNSVFGTAIDIANSRTVTVEKVGARFQFSVAADTEIDFLAFRIGSNPILTTGQTITTDNSSFPISQVGDRNYRDPA